MEEDIIALLTAFRMGQDGAFDAICEKYRPLVESACASFMRDHGSFDAEEVRQEVIIALYQAARSYDTDMVDVTFGLYARVCIRNRLYWLAKQLSRRRTQTWEDESAALDSVAAQDDPEERAMERDSYQRLLSRIRETLTGFENAVFALYLEGFSRKEICAALHITPKQAENALYRVRRKIKSLL